MSSQRPQFDSFAEFWPYYVGEHRKPMCRGLHFVAGLLVLAVVVAAVWSTAWWLLLLTPLAGYGVAWISHFAIEGNRPATWGYVTFSLMGEARMFVLMLTGRMRGEVERLYGSSHPAPEAPLRAER